MNLLKDSITRLGVIEPVIMDKNDFVIAGKRRKKIADELKIKVKAVHIETEEPELLRVELLLTQRNNNESVFEVAECLTSLYSDLKKQGIRTDLRTHEKYDALELLSRRFGISKRSISRFIQISSLKGICRLMVIENRIPIKVGVQLSYLKTEQQDIIGELVRSGLTISETTVYNLRKLIQQGLKSTRIADAIDIIGSRRKGFKQMQDIYNKYRLYRYSDDEVKDIVDKALSSYLNNNKLKWY